jgi:hypothetical protein
LALTTKMLQPFIRVSWTWSANQLVRMPLFFFQPIVRKTLGLLISFPLSQSDNHQRKRKKARTVIQSQVSAVWLVFLIGGASPLWNGMANPPRHTGKERKKRKPNRHSSSFIQRFYIYLLLVAHGEFDKRSHTPTPKKNI